MKADLAVIMAAGKGRRMGGTTPKPLQKVAGLTMLEHVGKAARLAAKRLVVVLSEEMREACAQLLPDAAVVVQTEKNGTGGAARVGFCHAQTLGLDLQRVLFLNGDAPLIRGGTLQRLTALVDDETSLAVLGFQSNHPHGYGRLVLVERTGSALLLERIVEEDECNAEQEQSFFCSAGAFAAKTEGLHEALLRLPPSSARRECRLSDLPTCFAEGAVRVYLGEKREAIGVNNCAQLAEAEKLWQEEARATLLNRGVVLRAPETLFVSHDSKIAAGAIVEPYVVLGEKVSIDKKAHIHSFCHIAGAKIGEEASVGPFARIRGGSSIGKRARIGNFVETKNARLGAEARASHLTYLGDCEVGRKANIGAGVITCNFDGFQKHKTKIGAQAFIGSNSSLIAPLSIGARAVIGASSAISRNVPAEALVLERSVQQEKSKGALRMRRNKKTES